MWDKAHYNTSPDALVQVKKRGIDWRWHTLVEVLRYDDQHHTNRFYSHHLDNAHFDKPSTSMFFSRLNGSKVWMKIIVTIGFIFFVCKWWWRLTPKSRILHFIMVYAKRTSAQLNSAKEAHLAKYPTTQNRWKPSVIFWLVVFPESFIMPFRAFACLQKRVNRQVCDKCFSISASKMVSIDNMAEMREKINRAQCLSHFA